MSVCSSGVQRRKKLENKQKFVFDEKDVASLPRAAVKPSSIQVDIEILAQIYASVTFNFHLSSNSKSFHLKGAVGSG